MGKGAGCGSHTSGVAFHVCMSLRLIASVPKLLVSSGTTHATPVSAGGCFMLSLDFKLGETAVSLFPSNLSPILSGHLTTCL